MSATTMKLEYVLTKEQFLEEWKKDVSSYRRPIWSKVASTLFLALAISSWGNAPIWLTAMQLLVAAQFWWMPKIVMSVTMKIAFWSRSTIVTRIEVDSEGVSVHNPEFEHAPRTYRWSDFSHAHETEFWFELKFKRRPYGVGVPWIAFTDSDQRAEFVRIVQSYLPNEPVPSEKETPIT